MDLNRAIRAGDFGIKGNKPKLSYGGRLVLELLETQEYIMGNSSKADFNIEKIETKIKFQAFGKTKPSSKLKISQRLEGAATTRRQ